MFHSGTWREGGKRKKRGGGNGGGGGGGRAWETRTKKAGRG